MKFLFWSSLLVLWILESGTEGNSSGICQKLHDMISVQTATEEDSVEKSDVNETFLCLLYPSNHLNCSWAFHSLHKDAQLSVQISVCSGDVEIKSLKNESVERDGSTTLVIPESEMSFVMLRFNMSLHGKWKTYTYEYDKDRLDLLSPPPNISVSVSDKVLNVTWGLPSSRATYQSRCFEYQLDMGDQFTGQNRYETIHQQQSYSESNAEPTHTYRLRMRARIFHTCYGCTEWSNWSQTVVVEQSVYKLNLLVVILLSLGVHLILLALLLLLRHRRVFDILFPPIPHPPKKYKYFLEKNDAFNLFYPAVPAKPEEDITQIEDTEKTPPNIL